MLEPDEWETFTSGSYRAARQQWRPATRQVERMVTDFLVPPILVTALNPGTWLPGLCADNGKLTIPLTPDQSIASRSGAKFRTFFIS